MSSEPALPTSHGKRRMLETTDPYPVKRSECIDDPEPSTNARLSCSQCAKTFSRRFTLQRHVKTEHTAKAKLQCDIPGCTATFTRAETLDRHKVNQHDGGKVPCPKCQRLFRKDYLQEHLDAQDHQGYRIAASLAPDTTITSSPRLNTETQQLDRWLAEDEAVLVEAQVPASSAMQMHQPSCSVDDPAEVVPDDAMRDVFTTTAHPSGTEAAWPSARSSSKATRTAVDQTLSRPEPRSFHKEHMEEPSQGEVDVTGPDGGHEDGYDCRPLHDLATVDSRDSSTGEDPVANLVVTMSTMQENWLDSVGSRTSKVDHGPDKRFAATVEQVLYTAGENVIEQPTPATAAALCETLGVLAANAQPSSTPYPVCPRGSRLTEATERYRALPLRGFCPMCSKRHGPSPDMVRAHARAHFLHPPAPQHQCSQCSIMFLFLGDLELHKTQPHACRDCSALEAYDNSDWVANAANHDQQVSLHDLRVWEKRQVRQELETVSKGLVTTEEASVITSPSCYMSQPRGYARSTMSSHSYSGHFGHDAENTESLEHGFEKLSVETSRESFKKASYLPGHNPGVLEHKQRCKCSKLAQTAVSGELEWTQELLLRGPGHCDRSGRCFDRVTEAVLHEALLEACANGHNERGNALLNAVEGILRYGASANHQNARRKSALLCAAIRHFKTNVAELLLRNGADVGFEDLDRSSLLIAAVENGHTAIVSLLLRYCANVNKRRGNGDTPLVIASRNGYYDIAVSLLDAGALVDAPDSHGWTSLHRAAWNGHSEVVELLSTRGAKVNKQDKNGNTPLIATAMANKHRDRDTLSIVRTLLRAGADVNIHGENERTALMKFAKLDQDLSTQRLLAHSANVDARDQQGCNALMLAGAKVKKQLLSYGVDIEATNLRGETALQQAAGSFRGYGKVELLLQHKADIHAVDLNGQSAWMHAMRGNNPRIAKLLITHGSDTGIDGDMVEGWRRIEHLY